MSFETCPTQHSVQIGEITFYVTLICSADCMGNAVKAGMMKSLRITNSFSPGNRPSTAGNSTESSGTSGLQRRNKPKPPPLQLVDQPDGGQTHGSRERIGTPNGRLSSRRISESASNFPFYHSYLTEDQEEEAFKHHLFKTGSFLMRDSKSNSHAVTMSVVIDPLHLYHFQVVQATSSFNVVGTGNQFSSLEDMIEYYKRNNIPGKTDNPVFLTHPVNRDSVPSPPSSAPPVSSTSRKSDPTTPIVTTLGRRRRPLGKNRRANSVEELSRQGSPKVKTFFRVPPSPHHDQNQTRSNQPKLPPIPEPGPPGQPATELYEDPLDNDGEGGAVGGATGGAESATASSSDKIDLRPPMPIPRPGSESESEYSKGHDYSEADHPDLDRIKMVLELCRQSDVIHASRKKCTCGLYLEESILVQGWMMHVDNEPGKTQGRIFFLDTKTNTTTWSLPEDIATELKNECPVKWEFVKKQLTAAKQKCTPATT